MRFDSIEHLTAWQASGAFPRIHNAIFALVSSRIDGAAVLDLGCSYGLLGQRIYEMDRSRSVYGIDADKAAIDAGIKAGIELTLLDSPITRAAAPDVIELIAMQRIDVLVARRILPELFGEDLEFGWLFAELARQAGIKQVFLEGRVQTKGAVNPLDSIEAEVGLLAGAFVEKARFGAVSYLVRR